MIIHAVTNPELFINARIAVLSASAETYQCFALEYTYQQYYLPGQPQVNLMALIALEQVGDTCLIHAGLSCASPLLQEKLGRFDEYADAAAFAAECEIPWLNLSCPLLLAPVYIPKPWGQEIWYTGIEVRGQSAVTDQEHAVPLPWLLSLMPEFLTSHHAQQIVLLKILDPLPDDPLGDLYFEMHEQKQEVYVVTHVDGVAWPDGWGGIRLGFDQRKRAEYDHDEAFKKAYLDAVNSYELIRREIDQQLDQQRISHHVGLNDPLDALTLHRWQGQLSAELLADEREKRAEMYSFTAVKKLQVGDVIKVPCHMPHALLHGVRTVEFQTPVYERQILSFAQKVLTQEHWDTAAAMHNVILDAPDDTALLSVYLEDGVVVEQVVAFTDFEVQRICLSPGHGYSFQDGFCYRVMMVISGSVVCYATEESGLMLAEYPHNYLPGQAMFLPASSSQGTWRAGNEGAILLVAIPITPIEKNAGVSNA